MSENRENMFKNDMGCGVGERGGKERVSRLIQKKNEIRRVEGEERENQKTGEEKERNKEKGRGRACVSTCL